jgi:hypothetical protein
MHDTATGDTATDDTATDDTRDGATQTDGREVYDATGPSKTCTGCGVTLPVTSFPVKGSRRHSRCTPCKNAYQRERHAANPTAGRDNAKKQRGKSRTALRELISAARDGAVCNECGSTDALSLIGDGDCSSDAVRNQSRDRVDQLISAGEWVCRVCVGRRSGMRGAGVSHAAGVATLEQCVLDAVTELDDGDGANVSAILDHVSSQRASTQQSVRQTLSKLKNEEKVTNARRGRWRRA